MSARTATFRRLVAVACLVPMVLTACAPQAPAASKPAAEPTKPAAAAPAAPAAAPAAPAAAPAAPAASPAAAPAPSIASAEGATTKAPADKRQLNVATAADITTLDPHFSTSANDIFVTFQIFDNLTTRTPDLKLIPQLATEWKTVNDTTWEFKLRPNVKFHNGDPLTSKDVKFTIERLINPETKALPAAAGGTIARVETPDDLTVQIVTKAPDPLLPARVGFYGFQILPQKYLTEVGPEKFALNPVGSGVVKFKSWVKDSALTLEANKEYWGGAPDFDTVVFRPVPEAGPRVASILAGEADIITKVPSDKVDEINKSTKARVEAPFYAGLYVLAVNSKVPPLDNPKVKQALSLAIDRDAIVKSIWRGQGIVPNGPINRGSDIGYDPNRPPLAFDLNKAKALLQEAGYKDEPIIIESTQGQLQNDRVMSEAIAEMWKKAGVNVQIEIIDAAVRGEKNRNKTFKGLFWSDPTDTIQDPDGMMYRLLGPGGSQDYWRHPEWDDLGAKARTSLDKDFRDKAYKRMTEIHLEHFPWIPVVQPLEAYAVASYLNWKPNPNQLFQLRKDVLQFNR
jgi:peptide/nickel transport system substrate-binding protein